ncbi:MAG: hypothetical protein WC028_31840 [Candidatus Obscuribacterales bacterium]
MFPQLSQLSQIKPGADIGPDQFEKTFGKAPAAELKKCKVTRIVNKGGTISVTTSAVQEMPLARGGKMRLAKSFSFQFASQSKKISVSKIKGIEATRPDAPGWVNLLAIELTASGDKVTVACKVSKLFFSLTLSETYSLKEIEALGWKMPT